MNPDVNAELPQLKTPESHPDSKGVSYGLETPEFGGASAEMGNSANQSAPVGPATQVPTAPTQADSTAAVPPASIVATTPAIAGDTDLIEKEWVLKAKQIVEQTRDDPFRQNAEMHKIKAEYIKKRYNKDIKLVDD